MGVIRSLNSTTLSNLLLEPGNERDGTQYEWVSGISIVSVGTTGWRRGATQRDHLMYITPPVLQNAHRELTGATKYIS